MFDIKILSKNIILVILLILFLYIILANFLCDLNTFITIEGLSAREARRRGANSSKNMLKAKVPVSEIKNTSWDVIMTEINDDTNAAKSRTTFDITAISEKNPTQTPNKDTFKVNEKKSINIPTEISTFTGAIVIAPQGDQKFPTKFVLKLTNNIGKNKIMFTPWGSDPVEKQPINNMIGPDNYAIFNYNTSIFSIKDTSGKLIDGVSVGGLNIGKNAINAMTIGTIYDRKNIPIGKPNEPENVITITVPIGDFNYDENVFTINCNNADNVTGIIIHLAKANTTV